MHFLLRQIPYSATSRINPDVVMQNMHVLLACLVVSAPASKSTHRRVSLQLVRSLSFRLVETGEFKNKLIDN